jgi:uncharacterized protein
MWVWLSWLAGFYVVWTTLVVGFGHWSEFDVQSNWPIALSMGFGGYAAGSTPMGGGTVGFPILVLLFEQPASLGRDFSFAVQSIGMTSASIFIFARRIPLATTTLKGALIGSTIGTPLGIWFVAPQIPDLWIKLVFAVVWGSFGILHLCRMEEIAGRVSTPNMAASWELRLGLLLGLLSAAFVAAPTGVGIDMILYTALVLLYHMDLRVAIPTSVVIMAYTSVLGIATKVSTTGIQAGVYEKWLAAAPVVALGAPLGAYIVALIGRRPTLLVVAILCVFQFFWTMHSESDRLGMSGMALSVGAVGICLLGFEGLRRLGAKLAEQRLPSRAADPVSNISEPHEEVL